MMAENDTIKPESFDARIDPIAFQHYAKDFYDVYKVYKNSKSGSPFSPARFFLLTRSIELAAKGLHLRRSRTASDLQRKIGHNLNKACNLSVLKEYGITLSKAEKTELGKANTYYKTKGFEYFLFSIQMAKKERKGHLYSLFRCRGAKKNHEEREGHKRALGGWPGLPDEGTLETILTKLLEPEL